MKRTIIRPNGVPNSTSEQVATPIMPSVVYASQSPNALDEQYEGKQKGYTYAREGHPNAEILARLIDNLEGSSTGLVVSSGMAAIPELTTKPVELPSSLSIKLAKISALGCPSLAYV